MFQTITNVGEAVSLQQCIDNRDGCLHIGLRSITFTVGWYNVGVGERFRWREKEGFSSLEIRPGMYSFTQLKKAIDGAGTAARLTVSEVNGFVTLIVARGLEVSLTDGLLTMLGLDDGRSGTLLGAGTYHGDRPVDFATRKVLRVHLDQVNTSSNIVDGAPSTLLTSVGMGCHSFGDVHTVCVGQPEFKRLQDGYVDELKVTVQDEVGQVIDNHGLPISLTLEVRRL